MCNAGEVVQSFSYSDYKCLLHCLAGDVNNGGVCGTSCDFPYYMSDYGTCQLCLGEYDGGIYFNRTTQTCQDSCTYYSIFEGNYICQSPNNMIACPFKVDL